MTSIDLIFESERKVLVYFTLVLIYSHSSSYYYRSKNSFLKSYMKNNRPLLLNQMYLRFSWPALHFIFPSQYGAWTNLCAGKRLLKGQYAQGGPSWEDVTVRVWCEHLWQEAGIQSIDCYQSNDCYQSASLNMVTAPCTWESQGHPNRLMDGLECSYIWNKEFY